MKVQIYGDSIMKAILVDENYKYKPIARDLLAQLRQDTGVEAVNRAHFGYTVDRGQDVLRRDLEKGLDCQYALLEFGGNDCDFNWSEVAAQPECEHAPHTPLRRFLDTMQSMAQTLMDAGVRPVLMSLPPLDAQRYLDFIGRLGNNTQNILRYIGDVQMIYRYQEMYSAQLARLSARLNLPLVDVRARFLERRDYGKLIARDGIHLTREGYGLIYDEFRRTLLAGGAV